MLREIGVDLFFQRIIDRRGKIKAAYLRTGTVAGHGGDGVVAHLDLRKIS